MLVDTQPATYQHVPATAEVRDQWVNSRLIGVLMDNVMPSLGAALMAIPVVVFVMWGEVNTYALVAWAITLLCMIAYRYRMLGIYRLRYDSQEGPQRLAFVRRYQWTWLAVGLLWGSVVVLSYARSNVGTQFICGMLVLGQGLLTLVAFSSYLPIFRRYANTVVLTVAFSLVFNSLAYGYTVESLRLGAACSRC